MYAMKVISRSVPSTLEIIPSSASMIGRVTANGIQMVDLIIGSVTNFDFLEKSRMHPRSIVMSRIVAPKTSPIIIPPCPSILAIKPVDRSGKDVPTAITKRPKRYSGNPVFAP